VDVEGVDAFSGYGYRAAVEEGREADVQQLFATNFFGAVDMIKAVLPGMRARRSGVIVSISSTGARISPPGSGYYSATKAALEALSASLRKEVAPLGITAMVVENSAGPGCSRARVRCCRRAGLPYMPEGLGRAGTRRLRGPGDRGGQAAPTGDRWALARKLLPAGPRPAPPVAGESAPVRRE
jgi:NAD(P)-dependent dehydrogenase (short-subunit alcohol dehydrogenase family)